MALNGTNAAPGTTRPEREHGPLRRHAFITVLVLVAVFPLAIFTFTYWINKDAARSIVQRRLLKSVRNARRLNTRIESALAMAENLGHVDVLDVYQSSIDAATKLYDTYVTPAFKKMLEEIQPDDEMLDFAQLLDARGRLIVWFGEPGRHAKQGDVGVKQSDTSYMLLRKVEAAAKAGRRPVVSMAFPTRIGERIVGTMLVGLSFDRINKQVQAEMKENNGRALAISVVGSVLLAALGGYLLKLHDKAATLQSALDQRRHLAYVGTISAGLAHEIRNPLSSVKMNVQMIRDRLDKLNVDDRENLLRKIDRVSREADRLEESVSDFLVFAAPRPLRKQPADINAAVDSVVEFLSLQQEHAQTEKNYAPDLPDVEIDQDMFTEMLQNLIINAFQAAGDNGTVEVATFAEKNAIAVAVSDNGPGVPEDERERIFEVFHTTKQAGTGLGLNIAKRIAEEHEGTIVLEKSSRGGARFVVRLPLNSKR